MNSFKQSFYFTGTIFFTLVLFSLSPIVFADFYFHDELWMLGWSERQHCLETNLFWGSYFFEGRYTSAFLGACLFQSHIMPFVKGLSFEGVQTSFAVFRFINLIGLAAFFAAIAALQVALGRSRTESICVALCLFALPGFLFMVLWGHGVVFAISFYCVALWSWWLVWLFSTGRQKTAGAWYLVAGSFVVTYICLGSYTITGFYPAIVLAVIVLRAKDFYFSSAYERAARWSMSGFVLGIIAYFLTHKMIRVVFASQFLTDRQLRIDRMSLDGAITMLHELSGNFIGNYNYIYRIISFWIVPDQNESSWILFFEIVKWICFSIVISTIIFSFLGVKIIFQKNCTFRANASDVKYPNFLGQSVEEISARSIYWTAIFLACLGFLVAANTGHYRSVLVAQSVLALIIFAMIFFVVSRIMPLLKDIFAAALRGFGVTLAAVIFIASVTFANNNTAIFSAREEGVLTTALRLMASGQHASIHVHWPKVRVWPDSFGPTILYNHRPLVLARQLFRAWGEDPNRIGFISDWNYRDKKFFVLYDRQKFKRAPERAPMNSLFIDGPSILPQVRSEKFYGLNARASQTARISRFIRTVKASSNAFPDEKPAGVLGGRIWHSERHPTFPQQLSFEFSQPLSFSGLQVSPQPGVPARAPHEIRLIGVGTDEEVLWTQSAVLGCPNSGAPTDVGRSVEVEAKAPIAALKLVVDSNCGSDDYVSIGRLNFSLR